MKSLMYVLCLLFCIGHVHSQELQKVIPLSPNAAAIAKYGEIPVGTFTGVPSIGIPLYTVKSRELELPLALSYHAGGNKVETIPSWVGLGWSVGTAPTISRSVRGLPDEGTGGFFSGYMGTSIIDVYNGQYGTTPEYNRWTNFLRGVKEGTADPEPDIYYYTLAGKSGKFFFSSSAQAFLTYPHENIKIDFDVNSKNFTLVTDDGVIYTFSVKETHTTSTSSPGTATTVSWLASKMVNANHTDSIMFGYGPETQYFRSSNSVTRYFNISSNDDCYQAPTLDYENTITSTVYSAYALANIYFSNGHVEFEGEEDEREDLQGSHALNKITVFDNNNQAVKKYEFEYSYLNSMTSGYGCTGLDDREKKWLMLNAVKEISTDNKQLIHSFTYENNIIPPCRTSPAQDFWGYYNGKTTNIDLMPTTVLTIPSTGNSVRIEGADRTIDESDSKFGIIKKVTYPTGGYTEYEFEQNDTYLGNVPKKYITQAASLEGEETITTNHYTNTFEINNPPDSKLNGENPDGGAFVNIAAGGFGCDLSGGSSPCANVTIRGTSAGNLSFFMTITGNSNNIYMPNGTYLMDALFDQTPPMYNSFYLIAQYEVLEAPENNLNKLVGGLRVKKITSYDGVSHNSDMIRKYRYTNSMASDTSSGNVFGTQFLNYVDQITQKYYWPDPVAALTHECVKQYFKINSYSNIQSISHSGSFAGYATVFTEYNEQNNFGITEQHFTNPPDVIDPAFPHAPSESFEHLRGLPAETVEYRKESNNFFPVKRTTYEYNEHVDSIAFGVTVASSTIYQYHQDLPLMYLSEPLQDGIVQYQFPSTQALLHKKTEWTYKPDDVTKYAETVTDYEYSPTHYQLTNTKTTNSLGQLTEAKNYYVQDVTQSGAAETARLALVDQHRINTVLKQQKYVASGLLEEVVTNYDKFNTEQIVMPAELFYKKGSGSLESRIKFQQYTTAGNLAAQQKTNDVNTAYIWGYNNNYPIAQVVNAGATDIFHTSFEDAEGNSTAGDAKTGRKSRTGGYSKALTGLTNGSYLLTWWLKSSGNWTLQTSNVTVSGGSYTISVSGQVDEIRFYPATAQMTTYTYDPLVGITSQSDVNNVPVYYQYDNFNRLLRIRDKDNNILKQYEYQYQYQPYDPTPNWQTTGATRCQTGTGSYATGHREHEEKDNNPYSSTYNTTRWIDEGLNTGACPVTADWQSTGSTRCQTGTGGYATGHREHEEKDNNPYSGTYNTTRWIDEGLNTGACAITADWQNTGSNRCKPCPANGSYTTNVTQYQQRDNNPYSSTYNQTQWLDAGTNYNNCTITPDWQNYGAATCAKDGYLQNTGEQVQEQHDINPCSAQSPRTISLGTNTGACPLPIYAKLTYENYNYGYADAVHADIVVRFYSDAACTNPVSVSGLTINYAVDGFDGSSSFSNDYSAPGTSGYSAVLQYSVELSYESGPVFRFKDYFLTPGTGYIAVLPL